jgi:hypothetical protein
MPATLLAIWLDAVEVTLLEKMMDRGDMPNLRALREGGAYGRLLSLEHTLSETVYGMVLTGHPPETTGTWNVGRFNPATYDEGEHEPVDCNGLPFFPQLCPRLRTCIFDIPGLPLLSNVNGIQVSSWGSHSPKVPAASDPPELFAALVARYGQHPGSGYHDFACLDDATAMQDLRSRILTGIPQRAQIACDLLGRETWDLFFMGFGESHGAGHVYWPHPDCLDLLSRSNTLDTMETVYRSIDEALGTVVAAAGPDARIVVFSTEGMSADNFDIPNLVFLPELLYRYSFPGCRNFDFDPARGPSPEKLAGIDNWVMEVWHQRRRPRPIEAWLRDRLPLPWAMRLFRWLMLQPPMDHPLSVSFWNFQPTTWMMSYRRFAKAFTLLTASDGCIRLNVRGRERHGIVRRGDFQRTCDDIETLLRELIDPASGEPVVRKVLRMRHDPFAWGEADHDADMVVLWNSCARNRIVSPRFGSFGPVPYHRTSAHSPDGFLLARGPGIDGGILPLGSPMDVAATILQLAGTPVATLPGRCRIPLRKHQAA